MIQLETLSGEIYQQIYVNETDEKYRDIIKYIRIPTNYPEYKPEDSPEKLELYTIYVQTNIKLFNKGCEINLDDEIDYDNAILQIYFNCKYLCYKIILHDNYTVWLNINLPPNNRIVYYFTNDLNLNQQLFNLIKEYFRFGSIYALGNIP